MLVWIDLEMTGLDPKIHRIVEIATIITDDELNVIATGPDLVVSASENDLALMEPFVLNMHGNSGLLEAIKLSSLTLEQAEIETLEFLKMHVKTPNTAPLCGNTIGTDRRFLAEQAIKIDDYLHYRSIDVSSIKELARRWNPNVLISAPVKKRGHRALDDIIESIEELKFYRDAFFKLP